MLNPNAIERITSLTSNDILLVGKNNNALSTRGRNPLFNRRIRYSDLLTSLEADLNISSVELLDEDNMVSDSDTKGATQQSIKAYVDNRVLKSGDTMTGQLTLQMATPILEMHDNSGASADESKWQWRNENGVLRLQPLTDAGSGGGDLMDITRTSNRMTSIQLKDDAVAQITLYNDGNAIFTNDVTARKFSRETISLSGGDPSVLWDLSRDASFAYLESQTDNTIELLNTDEGESYLIVINNIAGNFVTIAGVLWEGGIPYEASNGVDIVRIDCINLTLYGTYTKKLS